MDLPLDIRGTAFQTRVWRALTTIPRGQTLSYAEVARRIRAPTSTRAVAAACASNTLAVVVPCHRVVGSSGKLTGYKWGLDRKRSLLQREGVAISDDMMVNHQDRAR
jgi:AraC family transcriptional regulator of adaptative response/methylated-DNA-[protein]-cysteine methyltransferase